MTDTTDTNDIAKIILDAIDKRRKDPATPRCDLHYCTRPAMITRPFDVDGAVRYLTICEDCDDGLLWSSHGYIATIKRLLKHYNLKTGELFSPEQSAYINEVTPGD